MPYTIDYIEKECGLIVDWKGATDGEELIRSYHERFAPVGRLRKLRYIITDHTRSTFLMVTAQDIKKIARISNEASKINGTLYGAAVMPNVLSYGMARMRQAYNDDDATGWRTAAVATRHEAEQWLRRNLDNNLVFRNP